MTSSSSPEAGEYRLWTYGPARREIRILADGVPLNTASSDLADGEAKIETRRPDGDHLQPRSSFLHRGA